MFRHATLNTRKYHVLFLFCVGANQSLLLFLDLCHNKLEMEIYRCLCVCLENTNKYKFVFLLLYPPFLGTLLWQRLIPTSGTLNIASPFLWWNFSLHEKKTHHSASNTALTNYLGLYYGLYCFVVFFMHEDVMRAVLYLCVHLPFVY